LTVDAKNPPALAKAILKVLKDKLLSKKLSHAGLTTTSSTQFSWHTSARDYLNIYRAVLHRKHS
ncbi:MAG: glycosyltransferase family 1 protein, partial [Nanoarchaeota archaeon]